MCRIIVFLSLLLSVCAHAQRILIKDLETGRIGYLNREGRVVIKPQFLQEIERFVNHTAVVRIDTKERDNLALIDTNGTILTRMSSYYDVYTRPYAIITQNGNPVFINSQGKIVYDKPFDNIIGHGFYFRITVDNKSGIINGKGEEILPIEYDQILPFYQGMAAIQKNRLWGYMDEAAKITIPIQYQRADDFRQDNSAYVVFPDGKTDYVSRKISPEAAALRRNPFEVTSVNGYRSFDICENGWYRVTITGGDKRYKVPANKKYVVYFKRDSTLVFAKYFEDAGFFKNGITYARDGKLFGFIDTLGNWKIKPQYTSAKDFVNGVAPVSKDGRYGIINSKGETIVPLNYRYFKSINNSGHIVMETDVLTEEAYFDLNGNFLYKIPSYQDKSAANVPKQLYNEGLEAYKNNNYALAFHKFSGAAALGNKSAMLNLAAMYEFGEGTPINSEKALFYYTEADSRLSLGLFHIYNEKYYNPGETLKVFAESSRFNSPLALYELGKMYNRGIGVKRDTVTAALLLKNAIKSGHKLAASELAYLQTGKSPDEDYAKILIPVLSKLEVKGERLTTFLANYNTPNADKHKMNQELQYLSSYYVEEGMRATRPLELSSPNPLGIKPGMVVNYNGKKLAVVSSGAQYAVLSNGQTVNLATGYGLSIFATDDKDFRETCKYCNGTALEEELVKSGSFVSKDVTYKTGSTISGDKKITTYTEHNLYTTKKVQCSMCNGKGWRYKQ